LTSFVTVLLFYKTGWSSTSFHEAYIKALTGRYN